MSETLERAYAALRTDPELMAVPLPASGLYERTPQVRLVPPAGSPPATPSRSASQALTLDQHMQVLRNGLKDALVRRERRQNRELMTIIDDMRERVVALEEELTRP